MLRDKITASLKVCLALLFSVPPQLSAQSPPVPEVRHVLVDVVRKKDHVQIDDLNGSNFRVRLNGKPVRVLSAERVAIKPRVAVLIDTSGSMRTKWDCSVDLAKSAFDALQPLADVSFAEFSDQTKPLVFVSDPQQIADGLKQMRARPEQSRGIGKTALRDSVVSAIKALHLRRGDAVLLITDGGENISLESQKRMEQEIFQSGVRIFAIVIGGAITPKEVDGAIGTIELTAKTGGAVERFGSLYTPFYFSSSLSAKPDPIKVTPEFGSYIARRIVLPYILVLEAGATASGKIQVEAVGDSGQRMSGVSVSAPNRLEAVTPNSEGR